MKKAIVALALTLFLLTWPGAAEKSDLVSLFAKVSPAVGALYVRNSSGDLGFLCTVTAVDRDASRVVLLTANHCVKKDVAYSVTFDGRSFYGARVWKIPHEDLDANKYPRTFGEPQTDMAFFVIDESPLPQVPTVPLGSDELMASGKRIAVVGFPLGVAKISYEGIIAGRFNRPGSDTDGYLLIQAFGAPGSSGSAIIDEETGSVVGVLVRARQAAVGLPVIFATPIGYKKFLIEVPTTIQHYGPK